MITTIPVSPAVLRWARETAGLEIDAVVKGLNRIRITGETITAWESGTDSPSYSQLKLLAYQIYKRPLALFFFPKPPEEETPKQSFRTLPEQEIELMPARMRFLIRKARVMQLNLAELYDNINPALKNIVRSLNFNPQIEASLMAREVRKYLEIDLDTQTKWSGGEDALNRWREILETHGIYIFKDAFRITSFSGFCLYDEQFPIIYVNNTKSKNRQIFTLFHELAHLLFQTGGVDKPIEDYLRYLDGNNRLIEILCNRFAGEFLVPTEDFKSRLRDVPIDDKSIQGMADYYHVSREVILRKIYDEGLVDSVFYSEKVKNGKEKLARNLNEGGIIIIHKVLILENDI